MFRSWVILMNLNMVAKPGHYPGYLITGNKDLNYFPEMPEDFVYLGIHLVTGYILYLVINLHGSTY